MKRKSVTDLVWRALSAISAMALVAACATPTAAPPTTEGSGEVTEPTTAPEEPTAPSEPTAVPPTEVTAVEVTPSGEPRQGGTYRFLGEMDVATLDSAQAGNFEDWWSSGLLLYNQLYTTNIDGVVEPVLAAEMPSVSEDGLVYTIPLRQGVQFHNGREMTADDVKFTYERCMTVGWGADSLRNVVGAQDVADGATTEMSGIQIIDDYTIEITLIEPQPTFIFGLTQAALGIVPAQEVQDAGADWGTEVVIGTGPFMLKEWRTGEVLIYERNPNYFKDGLPYLDTIELYVNVSQPNAVLRWENDEAEFAYGFPTADLGRIQNDPALAPKLRVEYSTFFTYMAINVDAPPFDDPRVRQAVSLALDRTAYAAKAGLARPAAGFYPEIMGAYYNAEREVPAQNIEAAQALLAEAGYPDGISGISFYSGATGPEVGALIQADLAKIGIEVELLTGDYSVYQSQWDEGTMVFRSFGGAPGYIDPNGLMDRIVCPEGAERAIGALCDPRINELAAQGAALALDDPERVNVFREIETILMDENYNYLMLYFRPSLGIGQTYAFGDKLHPVYLLPNLETAWLDQ